MTLERIYGPCTLLAIYYDRVYEHLFTVDVGLQVR